MGGFIDTSPEDTRTAEDIVAAGGTVHWYGVDEDRCDDCGVDRNRGQGWCRCVGDPPPF